MSTLRNLLLGSKRRQAFTLLGIATILCVLVVEIACQAVAFVQFRGLDKYKNDPLNFVQASNEPGLIYELKPGFDQVIDGRRTRINTLCFRENSDELFADRRRIAIFGDSVAMGTGATQDATISALLQQEIDPGLEHTKVVNTGLLGLGLAEFPAHLRRVFKVYKPHAVIYILNPNDFVIRDTLYEGADGGMYRMFSRPVLKTPLVARKAVYRMKKGGVSPSNGWYRWTFDGTKERLWPRFDELKKICDEHGASFHVVLMPVRGSFDKADPAIADIYGEVGSHLTDRGIAWSDPSALFATAGATGAPEGDALIDFTDHYTPAGSKLMAQALRPLAAAAAGPAPAPTPPPAPTVPTATGGK